MNKLQQTLIITYSNQKARDIKRNYSGLNRVITFDQLIMEMFEKRHLKTLLENTMGATVVYKIIQDSQIDYFGYLDENALSLQLIFDFIILCQRNDVAFSMLLSEEKLEAIELINDNYQKYKTKYDLVDIADVEKMILDKWDDSYFDIYSEVKVDNFQIGDIDFLQSKKQDELFKKLSIYSTISEVQPVTLSAIQIKPKQEVFDINDEVITALKIARKLLEEGEDAEEILIVASDIVEYAPIYKLFLEEYGLQGYSSFGTSLSSFHDINAPKVKMAMQQYKTEVKRLEILYSKFGLKLGKKQKEALKSSIKILDEKTGIELTEPNQLVGLNRRYKHIIFMGTDINHFPPVSKDNFLYTYDEELQYFHANNYFTSSLTQYQGLKRLSDNLYIITASYSGKRELTLSIAIDHHFDKTIDVSDIKSVSELALQEETAISDEHTKEYFESISSDTLTRFDGMGVEGVKATHLSASQINKYLSCPLAYLYSDKVRLQAPRQSEEGFDVMEQGSLMHLCYELFGRHIKKTGNQSREHQELYKLMYEVSIEAYNDSETIEDRKNSENIHHQIFLSTLQAGLIDEREAGLLAKFVDYYIKNAEKLDYFQHSEFEKEFLLDNDLKPYKRKDENDYNYFIRGFIDRFDNLNDQVNVIDYKSKKITSKSGKHKETQEKISLLEDVQLGLYSLYAKQEHPNKQYYSSMLSFKGEHEAAHFGELVHEEFNEEYERKLREIIIDTRDSIGTGKFGFDNSDEKNCDWCDFKFICHAGVLDKLTEGDRL